jgi:hypothetical protein
MASFNPTHSDIKETQLTVRPSGRLNHCSYGYINRTKENLEVHHQMQHGTNCTPGYDPFFHKFCSKCGISDHHEFECARYYLYNPYRCKLYATLYHWTSDCKAITKKFGYEPTELKAELVALLIILETKYHISPLI